MPVTSTPLVRDLDAIRALIRDEAPAEIGIQTDAERPDAPLAVDLQDRAAPSLWRRVGSSWSRIARFLNPNRAIAEVAYTGSYTDLVNRPRLAPVATSGSYNDLRSLPDAPQLRAASFGPTAIRETDWTTIYTAAAGCTPIFAIVWVWRDSGTVYTLPPVTPLSFLRIQGQHIQGKGRAFQAPSFQGIVICFDPA